MDSNSNIHLDHPYIVKSKDVEYKDNFGIGYELFHYMKKYKNNIAQRILENNYEENYGTMLQKSISAAIKLRSMNLDKDQIVAVCADNHSNSNIPFVAALFLGYRIVAFDGSFSPRDTSYLLSEVTPAIMFIDEQFVPAMETAMKEIQIKFELIVFGRHDRYTMFDSFLCKNDKEEVFEPVKLENTQETGVILFTSGTTSLTKGICLPHYGVLKQAHSVGIVQGISSESVVCYFTALNWMTSASLLITCTMFGATRIICPITRTFEAIDKYKITHILMSPYLAAVLVNSDKPANMKENSVKSIWTTGFALSASLKVKLDAMFPGTLVAESYGQTEASGWITMFSNDEKEIAKKKPSSVGKIIPGIYAKVIHSETNENLCANQVGELHVKGDKIIMNGYFNRDTSGEFDHQGWLKTGDLVYYDEDECFYIAGRRKEMLKYRGFHVPPRMLEQILESHPSVEKAIVIGKTHELDGDHPTGLVVLHTEQHISPEILEQYVEKQVQDRQKLRGGVKIIKEIPVTRTGKPIRSLLKKMVENGELE